MRVLIVYPKMELYGGGELLVVRLANYLTKRGFENALLTTNILPEIESDLRGTRVIKYPFQPLKGKLKPVNLFKNILLLHTGVDEHLDEYDLINVHNYPAELTAFRQSKPVVWMCNEPPEVHVQFDSEPEYTARWQAIRCILNFEKYVVKKYVHHAVVADEFNARRFERMYNAVPHIVRYGIDFDYFAERPNNAASLIRSRRFTVLQAGMLTPLKNQLESLRTVDGLRDEIPDMRLVLAGFGRGQYLSTLERFVQERNLEKIVRFEGHVNRDRLRQLYHGCDVLLHPIKPQGGWLSPFEAISAGLPVVVSTEMSAADLLRENHLGIVTDDYAGALLEIYRNRSKSNELAQRRAQWVRDNLSWDRFSEGLLEVFHKAVNFGVDPRNISPQKRPRCRSCELTGR
jgi:glycosyltransferase involved in cell wall biosynthesis